MKNVPLSPQDEQEIVAALAEFAADVEDPVSRSAFETQIRKGVQARADSGVQNRIYFREELAFAQREGFSEPQEYAHRQAARRSKIDVYERNIARAFRQAKIDVLKFANKAAAKREKLSITALKTTRRRLQADMHFLATTGMAEKERRPTTGGLVEAVIQNAFPGYRLPHWEKTTLPLKVLALSVESHRQGAHTINLRLSREVDEAARRSPRGIVSYLQDRVRKALKEAFADDSPEFWFVIERDTATRFHLHGAVVVPHPGCEPMIDAALRKAGGSWSQKKHQHVGSKLNNPIWWAHYSTKTLNLTVLDIDTKLFASTLGIRRSARDAWPQLQRRLSA